MATNTPRFKILVGSTGEASFLYDEDDTAGVDESFAHVMQELRDPATGDYTVEGVQQLTAFTKEPANFARLKPMVQAYLARMQANGRRHLAEIQAMARTANANTFAPVNFVQNGFGVGIPKISILPPRGVPAFILGYQSEARTQRSVGLAQLTYASVPLVDGSQQTPAFSTLLPGGVPYVPLSFAMNEYHCDTRTCQPRLPAGSTWYPASPLIFEFVQTALVGDNAIPGQIHSLTIACITSLECINDRDFKRAMQTAKDEVLLLRQNYGNVR